MSPRAWVALLLVLVMTASALWCIHTDHPWFAGAFLLLAAGASAYEGTP